MMPEMKGWDHHGIEEELAAVAAAAAAVAEALAAGSAAAAGRRGAAVGTEPAQAEGDHPDVVT